MLIDALLKKNPWWEKKLVPVELKKVKRRLEFKYLLKFLDEKRITSIVSLRRTGKTTLMYQVIDHLLSKGVDEKRILYINFDELELLPRARPVNDVINAYFHEVLREDISELKAKVYIFFDEIHFANNWELELKNLFDLNKELKIYITGSSAIMLTKKAKESLAGRIHTVKLPLLTFYDFLKFHDVQLEEIDSIREEVKEKLKAGKVDEIHTALQKNLISINKLRKNAYYLFDEYVLKGAFPEGVEKRELENWQSFLKEDVIERVLFYDLPSLFEIREKKTLVGLLNYIAVESTSLISYNSLSQTFNLRKETINSYLSYLEGAFLIKLVEKYAKSYESRTRSMKKAYIFDSGVRNAILGKGKEILRDETEIGRDVEIIVSNFCSNIGEVHYWRDLEKNEVDIILNDLAIEVKYKKQLRKEDLKLEKTFEKGIVITKDILELRGSILLIPAWLFLTLIS